MTLNSIKEKKKKQYKQQSQKERDAVYARMLHDLERTRAVVRDTISRASTISTEDYQMTLTEPDFQVIRSKMDKIDQRLMDYTRTGRQSIKKMPHQKNVKRSESFINHIW